MEKWHFARPALAEQYLEIYKLGLSSNLGIIAPRRIGKTMFILRDLAPAAQKRNYVPVYASLWQDIDTPHEGIIHALEEAIATLDGKSTIKRLLQSKIKKTTLSNEMLGKMEIEYADSAAKASKMDLVKLDQLLTTLQKKAGRKTVLLIIDEVQHLATSEQFAPLSHALRTMLDKRQGSVKALFTGSSRHYMNLLFNDSTSPFYHFIEIAPFPDLDMAFVEFLVIKLQNDHGIVIQPKVLFNVFESIERSPYWMIKLIGHLVTFGRELKSSHKFILGLLEAAEGLVDIVKKMKPIDKIVYLALAEGESPFSQELLGRIEKETDIRGLPSNVQRSIKRLSERNLISQVEKGEYYIEKPGLRRYLLDSA